MNKLLKNIIATLILISIICLVFVKIGWLTSVKEIVAMFVITIIVITANILFTYIQSKIKNE